MSLYLLPTFGTVYLSGAAEDRLVAAYRAARAAGAPEPNVARAVITALDHEIETRRAELANKEVALQECMDLVCRYAKGPRP